MQHDTPVYPYRELPQHTTKESLPMHTTGASSASVPTTNMVLLGPENTVTTCPFCKASIKTAVKYTVTTRTHMAAAFCSFVCCCCCLPYCANSAKNSDHFCPNCEKYLGTYQK